MESAAMASSEWTVQGRATLKVETGSDGGAALHLERAAETEDVSVASGPLFAARPGLWEIAGGHRSDLYFQDLSFCASIEVEFLDEAGQSLERRRLLAVHGRTAWKKFRKRAQAPEGTTQGRLLLQINKTHGSLLVERLQVGRIGAGEQAAGADLRFRYSTACLGNLFHPGEPVRVEIELTAPEKLPAGSDRLHCELRDFWGVRHAPPFEVTLASRGLHNGRHVYTSSADLSGLPLQVGIYYALHTSIGLGSDVVADATSLAVLPVPATKSCDATRIPFGTHTWDARVKEYFPLSARLGLRRCLVFWNWSEDAPHTPECVRGSSAYNYCIDWPRQWGMRPYGMLYPIFDLERGDYKHDEASLREGVRKSIEMFKGEGLWGFQIGNEPPHWDPQMVKKDVEAYRIVYEEIKKTDPDIFVIGSAIGPSETFFQAGFQDYCDAYNIHAYSDLNELRRGMRKYRELFARYGGEKPIYSTEIGSKSQGLSRHQIAVDIVRKPVCFFADGGGFFTWFAISYPDPTGKRRGTYGDSMDLFAGYLEQYNPRLDAVAYYHIVNGICDKTFVRETVHADGTQGFLFRNETGACLEVLWNAQGTSECLLDLPGVRGVRVTHIDGRGARLDAGGRGISLRLGNDPVLVEYQSDELPAPRPEELPTGDLKLVDVPDALAQGGTGRIILETSVADSSVELVAPPLWHVREAQTQQRDGVRQTVFEVTVPTDSPAREATFQAQLVVAGACTADLLFRLPVRSRVSVDLLPRLLRGSDQPAVELVVTNHGHQAEAVDWRVDLIDETPMNGDFDFAQAAPAMAFFADEAEGRATVAPGQALHRLLSLGDVDRLTLYTAEASVRDALGKETARRRRIGGFAGVPRVRAPMVVDGLLQEADWQRAPVLRLDEARQFFKSEKMGRWDGPDDLSGSLRLLWDAEHLYIGVEVTDDVFVNHNADARIWDGDSLQFLIDPTRDQTESRGRYDYTFAHGTKGDQVWCTLSADGRAPTGECSDIRFVSRATGQNGDRLYEIAIPWARLAPFVPTPGGNLGLSMILNEDDGEGRGGFLGWFGGVHLKKVGYVGDLILLD